MLDYQAIGVLKTKGFKYIKDLGSGAFGNVVKVKHELSNHYFAIKILKNSIRLNPELILKEVQAIASLNDPNIINYKYSFVENDELYLVMEYCENGSLRDWINNAGKLDINSAIPIFLQLTQSCNFIHKNGFVHHDLKPDNILFTNTKVKISDFGTVNTKIGTINYSAPEMLMEGAPANDPKIDIFSLGITFMESVTGINPLRLVGNEIRDKILVVKNANYPISDLPYWLQQLLLKACHFNPAARFQTMIEFHEAIQRRHIPQIITVSRINNEKQVLRLKMLLISKRWNKARLYIESVNNDSVGFLIQKGKYFLETNQLRKAKDCFEEAIVKDRNAPVAKLMAEIYLQLNEPSKAATILHGFISNNFYDIEAHNQLLYSYFLSDQWELGLQQAKLLNKLFPKEEVIFKNNENLFKLLLGKEISYKDMPNKKNAIGIYNESVIKYNNPPAFELNDKVSLKSKLLFHEYRFRNLHKSQNIINIEFGDTKTIDISDQIITFGRKGYEYNTFSSFDDSKVSRRHFLIINQKNNVWLYDFSKLGTYVDGQKVEVRAFIYGRCEIIFGNQTLHVKSSNDLLL
jgi:serine/threonine protein kinase